MKHSISSVGLSVMLLLAIRPGLQAAELAPAALAVFEQTFLRDGSWSHAPSLRQERLLALEAVAKIDHPSGVPTLLVAAGDWEPAVRAEAQRQLLESRGVTLAEIRRQWLLSDDWFWRQGALRLEAIGALHHLDGREVPLDAWTLALGHERAWRHGRRTGAVGDHSE